MFTQTADLKDNRKQHNYCPYSNLIGEFTLSSHHYLILLLSEEDRTDQDQAYQGQMLQEVTRFEIQGQSCIIVKADFSATLDQPSPADLLSARELQIATLVALGRCNKQIARQLCISEWTVATYIRRIFDKLRVDSRAAMVYRCASLIQQSLKKAGS